MARIDEFRKAYALIEVLAARDPDPVVRQAAQDLIDSTNPAKQEATLQRALNVLATAGSTSAARVAALQVLGDVLRKGV